MGNYSSSCASVENKETRREADHQIRRQEEGVLYKHWFCMIKNQDLNQNIGVKSHVYNVLTFSKGFAHSSNMGL